MNEAAVAVTAMAWTAALGENPADVWQGVLDGKDGFTEVASPFPLRNRLVAVVRSVPADWPPSRRLWAMARSTASRAWNEPGGTKPAKDSVLIVGTSLGAYLEDDPPSVTPAHDWADRLAAELGMPSPPVLVATACSAGADAIAIGAEMVRSGRARRCLCGGVDVVTTAKMLNHSALGTLSPTRLRAFDERHDGTLLGEGAAFFVLEPAVEAKHPLAFLRGSGSASDAAGLTAPDPTGTAVALAVQRSLKDAGLSPADIGLVNAHASGTALNDATEREAYHAVFGSGQKPLIFGTKGHLGHSLGATGAIEAMALILALRAGQAPPTAGLEQPDASFRLPLCMGRPKPIESRQGLTVTLGFGGFDTALAFDISPATAAFSSQASAGHTPALTIMARAEATELDRSVFPSDTFRRIRYADPAAWAVATAAARLLATAGIAKDSSRDQVGLIAISQRGPAAALAAVAEAAREGQPSPLRYPAANPASLAGVACTALGLRGPTLNLLASPAVGLDAAALMARAWLRNEAAYHVVVAVCHDGDFPNVRARAALLSTDGHTGDGMQALQQLMEAP